MQDQINQDEIDALAAIEVPEEIIHQIPVEPESVEALTFEEKLAQYAVLAANGYNE